MEKSTKKKSIIISIVVAIALVGVSVGCYFIFRKNGLNFDYQKGAIASNRVENAQYTPDMDKFIEANSNNAEAKNFDYKSVIDSFETETETPEIDINEEKFAELIASYSKVDNYSGAGKYLGYDIYEIKNEIKFVVENVPAFGQWFRLPLMREEQGYIQIPYYESWAYFLELNEETSMLSITRVCWCTRGSYIDFENEKITEDHADGSSFVQYEIMKTNYLLTENDEIVESYFYSVGVDNQQSVDKCNTNTKDYYPFEYQYLKNVKDKYLIKYHISVSERTQYNDFKDDDGLVTSGMDIRGLNPYGFRREFTVVSYEGYTDIVKTEVDQQLSSLKNPNADGSVTFDINSKNIKLIAENVGLKEEDYAGLSCSEFMDKFAKQVIDNFEIKNNWATIYKESSSAYNIKNINGAFFGKDLPISDLVVNVSCRGHNKESLEFYCGARVNDISKFDLNKEYSLSMAFKNIESGEIIIVANSYAKLIKENYEGSDDFYYVLTGTNLEINANEINISKNGTYDIVCVLTEKDGDNDKVILDTLETAYLMQYYGLEIPDSIDNENVVHTYKVRGTGGKLRITVSTKQIIEV